MAENQFDWVEFYKEFAHKLLEYKNNRQELIEKVNKINIFIKTISGAEKTARLEEDDDIIDIDPFTFYGIFNKSPLPETKRIKIIEKIKELFKVNFKTPSSLRGIPCLHPFQATYYSFKTDRKENDIDNLWNLFTSALGYTDNKNETNLKLLEKYFEIVIEQKGIRTSKITMGLFWISSDTFLNLDHKNLNYIYNSNYLPNDLVRAFPDKKKIEDKISFKDYLEMIDKIGSYLKEKSKDFRQFSYDAWQYSEKNKKDKDKITNDDNDKINYWLYSPGNDAEDWEEQYKKGIIAIGKDAIGDLKVFKSKDEMRKKMQEIIAPQKNPIQSANTSWQFVHVMKPGDIVFAKKGRQTIIGRGIVSGDYKFDNNRKHHKNIREIKWTHKQIYEFSEELFAMKTLTNITNDSELIKKIENSFNDSGDNKVKNDNSKTIQNHLNTILYGPPGTGKTYNTVIEALRIINPQLINEYENKNITYDDIKEEFNRRKKEGQIEFITFHQSYSYEEFVEGIKPSLGEEWGKKSDELTYIGNDGIFKEISQRALYDRLAVNNEEKNKEQKLKLIKDYYEGNIELKKDIDKKYVLIIDEINRGNISKIFGELITLLEEDKRESFSVRLPYSHEQFTVPKNLYIIGTMNTSDRSIATIDIALRRRFTFKEMMPDVERVPDVEVSGIKLKEIFNKLNKRISVLLDRDHQIGHSYFMNVGSIEDLKSVWFNCVMPLLNEYFYNDWEKLVALLGEPPKDKNDGHYFIKRLDKIEFATKYDIDEAECYDFVSEDEMDEMDETAFKEALENAFGK